VAHDSPGMLVSDTKGCGKIPNAGGIV